MLLDRHSGLSLSAVALGAIDKSARYVRSFVGSARLRQCLLDVVVMVTLAGSVADQRSSACGVTDSVATMAMPHVDPHVVSVQRGLQVSF